MASNHKYQGPTFDNPLAHCCSLPPGHPVHQVTPLEAIQAETARVEKMRVFSTGANRDLDDSKPDYEGFFSVLVVERFGQYMQKHRKTAQGVRDSDNWQKGIPKAVYIKSAFRHFVDWWREHRGFPSREGLEDALCGLLFNVMGYLHEHLKERGCANASDKMDAGR